MDAIVTTWDNKNPVVGGNIIVSNNIANHKKVLKLLKPVIQMIPEKAQEILDFWFKETPAEKRFKKDEVFDKTIRDKFLNDYELASQNEYDDWQDQPMSALALVILFDQFSRNMFRDDKKAFAQDHKTRLIVNDAVYAGLFRIYE